MLAFKVANGADTIDIRYGATDPRVAPGEPAPNCSLYIQTNTAGKLYLKEGAADTDWAAYVRLRVVASGVTTVAEGATATLGPFLRRADERLMTMAFVTTNTAGASSIPMPLDNGSSDVTQIWTERTATANQFNVKFDNNLGAGSRTIDWTVLGTPAP